MGFEIMDYDSQRRATPQNPGISTMMFASDETHRDNFHYERLAYVPKPHNRRGGFFLSDKHDASFSRGQARPYNKDRVWGGSGKKGDHLSRLFSLEMTAGVMTGVEAK